MTKLLSFQRGKLPAGPLGETFRQATLLAKRWARIDDKHESFGAVLVVKMVVRDRESIQEAVRRFRKLVDRSGLKREMRRREFYEKPSETDRRARIRAERRNSSTRLLSR